MTAQNWASIILSVVAIASAFVGTIRWLVKHYLNELKPNSGTSLRDSVDRLERQMEEIYRILLARK